MQRFFITVCLIFVAFGAGAQNLGDVQQSIGNGLYDQAKEQIDKFLANPANQVNAQAWYYKGKIYAQLYKSDTANTITYDASGEAFDAFRKYQDMDKKTVMMTLDQHAGFFQLYDGHYNRGIRAYQSKNYGEAFTKLKAALEIEEYVMGKGYSYNGFSFPKLDTQLVSLTASAAYLAGREDDAIPYYTKLADAGLNSADYKEVYAMMGQHYQKKGDAVNATKYFDQGRKLFPDNDYWVVYEFGDPGTDNTARFKRYEELLKKYPDSYPLAMDYASELFNYAYNNEKKPSDYKSRQLKLETAANRALSLKSTSMANLVMSQHIANQLYDLEDELRAAKTGTPNDEGPLKEIIARTDNMYEELNNYSQAAFDLYAAQPTLKPQEKDAYKKVTQHLIDYYTRKKDDVKLAFYKGQVGCAVSIFLGRCRCSSRPSCYAFTNG